MEIQVLHYDHQSNFFEHVANVEVGDIADTQALEYAFGLTQNIEGSWSKSKLVEIDGCMVINHDFSEAVTTLKPLEVAEDGFEYGHRSTMVGDRMIMDGKIYEVEVFGFKLANIVGAL